MTENPSRKLACCVEASRTEVITGITDRSCCATKFAATRNTTEFVQTKFIQAETSVKETIIPQTVTESVCASDLATVVHPFYFQPYTLPHSEDTPVFYSSLLI